MSPEPAQLAGPITQLLDAAAHGDATAHERLWRLVYEELRRIAHQQMADERRGTGLQTTVLVHEAYLRLVGDGRIPWVNHRHFFAVAAKAMRHICVDGARKRERLKRGGPGLGRKDREPAGAEHRADEDGVGGGQGPGVLPGPGADHAPVFAPDPAELLALDEALSRLEQQDPRKAEIVMLRFFAGLTMDEIATAQGLAPRTVDELWRVARAWLHRELSGEQGE